MQGRQEASGALGQHASPEEEQQGPKRHKGQSPRGRNEAPVQMSQAGQPLGVGATGVGGGTGFYLPPPGAYQVPPQVPQGPLGCGAMGGRGGAGLYPPPQGPFTMPMHVDQAGQGWGYGATGGGGGTGFVSPPPPPSRFQTPMHGLQGGRSIPAHQARGPGFFVGAPTPTQGGMHGLSGSGNYRGGSGKVKGGRMGRGKEAVRPAWMTDPVRARQLGVSQEMALELSQTSAGADPEALQDAEAQAVQATEVQADPTGDTAASDDFEEGEIKE